MSEQFPHLELNVVSEGFPRRKRPGGFGYPPAARDHTQFYKTKIQKLSSITQKFTADASKLRKYYDPSLIVKIKLNNVADDDTFRAELRRAGIETISSAPDKKGYWVAFTDDREFTRFKAKLKARTARDTATFIDIIDDIEDIPVEEKIGELLKAKPFSSNEVSYLDIELWVMEESRLNKALKGIDRIAGEHGGEIVDLLTTKNFCLLRVQCNKAVYEKILQMPELAHIDRPPTIALEQSLEIDVENLAGVGENPPGNAPSIAIVDSGILHHPLLDKAIRDEFAIALRNGKITANNPFDEVGHGTQVAGIALYGDIRACIQTKSFKPEFHIISAKVMYRDEEGEPSYEKKELPEHQFQNTINKLVKDHPDCRIVNISFGDTARRMFVGRRQFNIAALVDDLARRHKLIFVVAAGNNRTHIRQSDKYPTYFLEESDRLKIIDPATSALALTVGALSKRFTHENGDIRVTNWPSPLTRIGPGLRDMIKPELVEDGGGGFGEETDITTLNPNWREGRLFTLNRGTSLSAPKVANHLAHLVKQYKDYSPNMIKALLISSAEIPEERPEPLSNYDIYGTAKEAKNIFNVYGHGKPVLQKALYSENNRILLIRENTIELNTVTLYEVNLPNEFVNEQGDRKITVTLVYDPVTAKTRTNYIGTTMETHLFKNCTVQEVQSAYRQTKVEDEGEDVVPEKIKNNEIKLSPGINLRKKSVHQKASAIFKRTPRIDVSKPLVLAVVCQDKGWDEEVKNQDYAIIVTVEHSLATNLYTLVKARNRGRARVR